jgi:nicotinamidase-related amidase
MMEQKHSQMQHAQIDPDDALVLFLDLQAGIVELTQTNPLDRLRRSVGALGKLATIFGMPVVVSAVPEQNIEAAMLPEIRESIGEYAVQYRATCDSFQNHRVRDLIASSGRRTILLSGVATELAVQLPALSASAAGYGVFVVIDACGGLSARTERAALDRIHQAGGSSISVVTLAGEIAGDLREPRAQQAIGILFELAKA